MEYSKKEDVVFKISTDKNKFILTPFSDVHFDSKKCERELLKKHIEETIDKGAYIYFNGDFLDVMGADRDPRSGKGDIRPEYDVPNYLDVVVEDAIKFLKPYKSKILFMSDGNHETNILRRQETNVLNRIAGALGVARMGYSGWIKVDFTGKNKDFKLIHFHHGFGGGAQRTKGVLRVDIDAAKYPDADIVMRGHDHQKWYINFKRRRFCHIENDMYKSEQLHLQLGSYKDGYGRGTKGWEVEKEFSDTPLGTWEITMRPNAKPSVRDLS